MLWRRRTSLKAGSAAAPASSSRRYAPASDDVRRNLPAAFAGRAFYERIVSLKRVLDVEARGRHAVDAIMTR
jgi:hypothetical protein